MQDRHKEHLLDSQKVLPVLFTPTVFWAIAHLLNSQVLDPISLFPILPFSSHGIIIPIVLLLLFLLLWVQVVFQVPHRIFSRPLPGSQKILLASMVRVQKTRMHGWPWCVITLFSWLVPRNRKLHTQPHSFVMLHRSGGLVTCGGIMGSIPVIGCNGTSHFGAIWLEPPCGDGTGPITVYHTGQPICA